MLGGEPQLELRLGPERLAQHVGDAVEQCVEVDGRRRRRALRRLGQGIASSAFGLLSGSDGAMPIRGGLRRPNRPVAPAAA
jgi:hypothetical protein